MTGADTTFGPSARRVAGACGWVIAAVGALVLLGWATDSTALKQVDAELPAMKALAALAIVALGIGIVLRAPERRSPARERAGLASTAFVAVIGIAVLFEHAFGGIGIDELLADDVGPDPGRPPLVAATTLTLCALALLTLDRDPPRYRASLWLTAVAALLTQAALVGFAYDVDYLRGRSGSSGVSLPGVLAAALAVTAIALSRPDRGAVAFFSGDDPASRFARRVAPVAIGVPIVLGVLRLAGEHAGLFGDDLGLAIVTLGSMAAVLAVIVLSARDLRHQAARGEVGEQSFRAVAEASLAAIVTADDRGRITYFNPAAERMFGYRAGEAAGSELTLLMPERYHAPHAAGLARFLETGEGRLIGGTVELVARRRDGKEFPVSLSLVDWAVDGRVFFTATIADVGARREAEQATRELAAIVEGSDDAVIGWSLDGLVRSWNRGAERVYGYSAEEMLGRSHDVLMPPGEESELPTLIERLRAGERIESFETARMRKDGRRIEVSLAVSPVLGEAGRVIAASTITRDVSEQKAAERKLAESARHFELINDLVATCGFDGYFKQLNGAWEPTLGWSAEELLPNPYADIIHPDDREAVAREVAKLARGGTTTEFRIRVRTKDGGWRWTEWSASPDLPSAAFHCVGREITERMEVERALAAERRQLADAQQLASVGSWELDLASGSRTWSAQQFRNHGFDPAEPIPEFDRVLERVHPDDQVAVLRRMAAIEAGDHEFEFSYRVVLPDGGVREIVSEGRPFTDAEGSTRVMGTSRDVTAERDAERLKDDFFGLVSHELRTPLTSIIGYTEMLSEIEAGNLSEQGRRFVEVIERNSRRELSLVGDLLLLTRITAGTFEIELARADLAALIGASAEQAGPDLAKAGVEIELDLAAAPVIDADPHRLGQVVDNLLSNAIKFTPRGGRIAIRAASDGERALIAVSDTGIGIPPSDSERLFERTYRAAEAERRHIQGTGLGLTIVKAIVDAHHGSISVESEVGRGTTFTVELPVTAAENLEADSVRPPPPAAETRSPLKVENE